MSRSRIEQAARSAEDIPGRCDVTKIGEYGNQFLKPVATFSLSTHGTL